MKFLLDSVYYALGAIGVIGSVAALIAVLWMMLRGTLEALGRAIDVIIDRREQAP